MTDTFSSPPRLNPMDEYTSITTLMLACPHIVLHIDTNGTIVRSTAPSTYPTLKPGGALPDILPQLWIHIRKAPRHGPSAAMSLYVDQKRFAAWTLFVTPKGNAPHAVCILESRAEFDQMVTRMQDYQALSQELDAIIDSSDDGLWVCDASGTVLRINAASERMNMIRAEKMLGRSMADLVKEGFVDRSVTMDVIKTRKRQNLIQRTRSGRTLILTGNPVFDDAGELVRVVVNERDITEISELTRELEEQTAIKEKISHQILEMQLKEITADTLITRSPSMVKTVRQALKLGKVKTTVLILGESGTGKGLIAKLIHKHSDRSHHPLIDINCGAIPENLVETELFGYRKGAFTGADQKGKPGYLELAHQGTLFLDEIAELPLSSQVKLLHFLENNWLTRVGDTVSRQIDVRILCATNQNLAQMVDAGQFRKDLYYRLNVIPITIPPLRDRRECIFPLLQHYLSQFSRQMGITEPPRIARDALDMLMSYNFPGNVRELINLCERLVVMADSDKITCADLPASLVMAALQPTDDKNIGFQEGKNLTQILSATERRVLQDAYHRYGSQARMAKVLGVNQSTIARKMKKYRLA